MKNKFFYFPIFLLVLFFCRNLFSDTLEWLKKDSTHFIIYYQDKDIQEDFLNKIATYAENYYNSIANNLGFTRYDFWLWDDRAKIYIFKDHKSYTETTNQPAWSGGFASGHDKTITTYPQASGFFDSLLPHELGHIIFREFIGFNRRLPLWLEEGVAVYQEEARRWGSKPKVREAIAQSRLISLKDLNLMSASAINSSNNVDLFYDESVSIVDFLITKFGKAAFNNFCCSLRDGKTLDEAINKNYPYKDLDGLDWSWQNYLKNS